MAYHFWQHWFHELSLPSGVQVTKKDCKNARCLSVDVNGLCPNAKNARCLSVDVIGLCPNAKNIVKTYSDNRGKSSLKFCVTSVTDTSTVHIYA